MSHSDPIADMLTRMRNAQLAGHKTVRIPHSNEKENILHIIKNKAFISEVEVVKENKFEEIIVTFNKEKNNLILKRVSKPGQRIYRKHNEIIQVKNGFGISVISTSEGVMAGYEAYKKKIGGEILLEIY